MNEKKEQELINETPEKKNDSAVQPVSAGVTGEEYDIDPEIPEEETNAFEGEDGIRIEYTFNGDEIKNGLKVFQHETMFKKNLIYTLVLAAFFGIYSLSAFQKEPNGFTIFICIMCITVIAFIWYMPWNHRRMMKKGIDQSETPLDFVMTVYETGVKIEQENGACTMKFGEIVNKIAETEESFLLFAGKERLFVLPKRFVQDEDALRARFQNAVGEKYLTR